MNNFFKSILLFDKGFENLAIAELRGWDDIAKMVFLDCDIKRLKEKAVKEAEEKDC